MEKLIQFVRIGCQLAIVGAVWLLAEGICRITALPLSSGVLGLFIMLGLLAGGVVKVGMVGAGAKWVLGELVFFFIPIMVSVVQYRDLLWSQGWQLLLTIAAGTVLVMLSTAFTLNYCYRLQRRWHKKFHA
ncbi:CidA/LrgA family protein [Uruburuella testudinis]|uniref:CidA/LrgA family protein n=1 Tax=Uruburuella testudinis TaxID=1282863 RepID=A0ABY4DTM7_9NEIS|nr:CidA/LrgA family protein [Uruburuella testudinis]UOO82238.1 CidA/LrgA family protein [Uruburuella testudinis]